MFCFCSNFHFPSISLLLSVTYSLFQQISRPLSDHCQTYLFHVGAADLAELIDLLFDVRLASSEDPRVQPDVTRRPIDGNRMADGLSAVPRFR